MIGVSNSDKSDNLLCLPSFHIPLHQQWMWDLQAIALTYLWVPGKSQQQGEEDTWIGRDREVAGSQVRSPPPTILAHSQVPIPTDYHGRDSQICDPTEPPSTSQYPDTAWTVPLHSVSSFGPQTTPLPLAFVNVWPHGPHYSIRTTPQTSTTFNYCCLTWQAQNWAMLAWFWVFGT